MDVVELLTSETIRKSWFELLGNRLRNGHPPLFFLMSKLWISVTEHTQLLLYTVPIVIGAIGIPLMYLLASELGMGKWAWLASLLWTIHPSILYYSRYLRPQIGVSVLCCSFLLVLLKNLDKPKITNKIFLISFGMLGALWNHLLILFWLGILVSSLMMSKIRKHATKEYWLTIVSAVISHIIVILIVRWFSGPIQDKLEWVKTPTLLGAVEIFMRSLSSLNIKLNEPSYAWFLPIMSIFSILIVKVVVNDNKWQLMISSSLISVGILLGLTYTFQAMWVQRYLVIVFPVVILSMVQLILTIRWRPIALCYAVFLVLACIASSWKMVDQRNVGLRKTISKLEEQYDERNDVLLVLNIMTREALRMYAYKDLDYIVIRRRSDHVKAFKVLKKKIKNKNRLWVIEYPKKDSIIKSERWRVFKHHNFYKQRSRKTTLFGYSLPI